MSKNKDSAISAAVLDYLNKQNRPYSAIDIFNNLHKEYGKTAVVRALEQLAENKKIVEKTYGKQKIYYADQNQFAEFSEQELRTMDSEINTLTETLKEVQKQIKVNENELVSLSSSLTTEEVIASIENLKNENLRLEDKLDGLKNSKNAVSPEDRDKIYKVHEVYTREWRKRKRMASDILNAILEGYPKTKKNLYEEIGIETDEDVNATLPK